MQHTDMRKVKHKVKKRKMVRNCCYCKAWYGLPNLTFHRFPKDDTTKKLWINFVSTKKGAAWTPTASSFLCGQHFSIESFNTLAGISDKERLFLKRGAVPTVQGTIINEDAEEQIAAAEPVQDVVDQPLPDVNPDKPIGNSTPPDKENVKYNEYNTVQPTESVNNLIVQVCEPNEASGIKRKKTLSRTSVKRPRISNPHSIGDVKVDELPAKFKRPWNIAIKKIHTLNQKVKILNQKCVRLQSRIENFKTLSAHLRDKNLLSEDACRVLNETLTGAAEELFVRMSNQKYHGAFPTELQAFATTLNFYSPRAYCYVRKTFMNYLPHPKTISRWYTNVDGNPGITKQAIDAIRNKCTESKMAGKRVYLNLTIDEMSIKEHIEFNGEEFDGYVDKGQNNNNNALTVAKNALVFMAVHVNGHWKIPIAYYLINGLNGVERADLLKQCLVALHETEAILTSITVDGAPSNITMLNNMGANLSNLENLTCYFEHPMTKRKVYLLLDPCHMIKLIWNALAKLGVIIDGRDNRIKWEYFVELVDLQLKEGLHCATKIRRRHLNFEKEKMKVHLAVQVLSTSVANALTFCCNDLKLDKFQNAEATSQFCLLINNIFDLLNSRNLLCKNVTQACIKRENFAEVRAKTVEYERYLTSLRDNVGPILSSKKKTGFLGFIICLRSVIGISEMLFEDEKMNFLLTYKLSQDHLETFFSAVRSRGGFSNNPSTKQFKNAYKRLLCRADIRASVSANSTPLDNTKVLDVAHIAMEATIAEADNIHNDNLTVNNTDHDYVFYNDCCLTEYSKDIIAYIAGFVARKLKTSLKCTTCVNDLTSDQTLSNLQRRKCRGGLTTASADVVDICTITERVIKCYSRLVEQKNCLQLLMMKAFANIPNYILDNVNHMMEQSVLGNHRSQLIRSIIKSYLTLRLHHMSTTRNDAILRIRNQHTRLVIFKNQ